mmetsp:Transcript_44457/g.142926  ORF Transcript_44457/g.142926 Transcript_44457/m.142926 type:complete len:482 (-) Transcript_44457:1471-2916(-)
MPKRMSSAQKGVRVDCERASSTGGASGIAMKSEPTNQRSRRSTSGWRGSASSCAVTQSETSPSSRRVAGWPSARQAGGWSASSVASMRSFAYASSQKKPCGVNLSASMVESSSPSAPLSASSTPRSPSTTADGDASADSTLLGAATGGGGVPRSGSKSAPAGAPAGMRGGRMRRGGEGGGAGASLGSTSLRRERARPTMAVARAGSLEGTSTSRRVWLPWGGGRPRGAGVTMEELRRSSCFMSYSISVASCLSRARMSARSGLWSRSSSRTKRETSRSSGECAASRCRLSSTTIGTIASTVALRATCERTLPRAAAAAALPSSAGSSAEAPAPEPTLASLHARRRSESETTACTAAADSSIWPSRTGASTSWQSFAVACSRCSSPIEERSARRICSRGRCCSAPDRSSASFSSRGSGVACAGSAVHPLSWKRRGTKEASARWGERGRSMSKRQARPAARSVGSASTSERQKARRREGRHLT